jgi:hypothetical protein
VGNPAEETYCYPNTYIVKEANPFCQLPNFTGFARKSWGFPVGGPPELDGASRLFQSRTFARRQLEQQFV